MAISTRKKKAVKVAPAPKTSACSNCGTPGMGDAFFDSGWVASDPQRPGFDVDGRCETCGML